MIAAPDFQANETPDEALNPMPVRRRFKIFARLYCIKFQNNKDNALEISLWAFAKSPFDQSPRAGNQICQMNLTILDIEDCSTGIRIKKYKRDMTKQLYEKMLLNPSRFNSEF
ncbi:MAG: hypothetical protein MRJ52_04080 [Nitrosomonas sp.]|nr:hypothetical protein [Nitrosomonas sp.]